MGNGHEVGMDIGNARNTISRCFFLIAIICRLDSGFFFPTEHFKKYFNIFCRDLMVVVDKYV